MNEITVFTPTYNRAYCLVRLYESLINQTVKNFIWLIIDDGSADNTPELVDKWKEDGLIQIVYIYQKNQGMHAAHNTAYANITTEFNVCIDSDDFMPINAIEIILDSIESIRDNKEYAGIVGLDADLSQNIIGTKIPDHLLRVRLSDLYLKYKVKGDKKLVYKTDIVRKYPQYPIFDGEKFVPLGYLYQLIDQHFYLKPVNEILCIVEYLSDGSTKNILYQYRKNPRGFAFSRLHRIQLSHGLKDKFKNLIHLVSSCIFANDYSHLSRIKNKILLLLAFPLGLILNIYIRVNTK